MSNKLTAAEIERLAILAEEASEVAQAAMKILRHGYSSCPPAGLRNNREQLQEELFDLEIAIRFMRWSGDVRPVPFETMESAMKRKLRYTYHQQHLKSKVEDFNG